MKSDLSDLSVAGFALCAEDEAHLVRIAAAIARVAETGDVIALEGALGAGKTAFARAFIRALTREDEEVPSPTFTLVQVYERPQGPIFHFDLFRVRDAAEIHELGVEEAIADGIVLIEWPDKARALESDRWLTIRIETEEADPDTRLLGINGGAAWRDRLGALAFAMGELHDA